MRKAIAACAAVALIAAGTAQATSTETNLHFKGTWCKTVSESSAVICLRETGTGYAVAFSKYGVVVMNSHSKVVYSHVQPHE